MRFINLFISSLFIVLLLYGKSAAASTKAVPEELRELLKNTINSSSSFNDRFEAEVWLVDMSARLTRWVKDPKERLFILKTAHKAAMEAGVQPELVLAVMQIESSFNRFALSHAGARGLMQIMPFWKKEIGRTQDNLFEINTNLRYGCTILKYYLDKEKGDMIKGLARYNGSYRSNKYPEKVLLAWERNWFYSYQ